MAVTILADSAGETTIDIANVAFIGVQASGAYPGVCTLLLASGVNLTFNADVSVVMPAFRATRP